MPPKKSKLKSRAAASASRDARVASADATAVTASTPEGPCEFVYRDDDDAFGGDVLFGVFKRARVDGRLSGEFPRSAPPSVPARASRIQFSECVRARGVDFAV